MREFHDVELWRVSAFQRLQRVPGNSAYVGLEGSSVLSSSLMSELNLLRQHAYHDDALEVFSACLRHAEATLLYLQYEQFVWPVTIFPAHRLCHAPRDLSQAALSGLANIRFLRAEPPGVRPPGHSDHERIMPASQYRPVGPLLRTLALHGPRKTLLSAITSKTKFRLNPGTIVKGLNLPGALGSAARRMRSESASLREVTGWPGMNAERASRLINALYLSGELILSGQAERSDTGLGQRLINWARSRS